jgi:3-oxoacyl-[acyl-carrier protein] reductase
MDLGLKQRAAVVLASTEGLGLAAAKALLAEGARVAISGRDPGRLARALAGLESEHGQRVLGSRLDVTDGPALLRHLDEARERFGGLHILVTNAGGPPAGNAAEVGDEALDAAYELTLKSAVRAVRHVLPWMRAERHGRIVAMTSSSVRQPIPGLALSNTLRAGLTGWLKTVAREVAADGVLVNSICTGMFETDRLRDLIRLRAEASGRSQAEERAALVAEIPLGRLGRLEEFGATVAFLCSDRASFLSGIALPCDGGASRPLL